MKNSNHNAENLFKKKYREEIQLKKIIRNKKKYKI